MPLLLLAVLTNILLYADILFQISNFLLHEKGNYVHADQYKCAFMTL